MGLRERALDYTREHIPDNPEDANLALTPRDTTVASLREAALAKLKANDDELLPEPGGEYRADSNRFLSHSEPDDLTSLPNVNPDQDLSYRVEALNHLLDTVREIAESESTEEIYSQLLLSIISHLGSRHAMLSLFEQEKTILRATRGFELPAGISTLSSEFWKNLFINEHTILYTRKIIEDHAQAEPLLLLSKCDVLLPLYNKSEMTGFLAVDHPANQNDFTLDNLFFLQQAGNIMGALKQFANSAKISREASRYWHYRDQMTSAFNNFQAQIQLCKNSTDRLELLQRTLNEEFKLSVFVLTLRDEFLLKPLLWQGISAHGASAFEMPLNDSWIQKFSTKSEFSEILNWKDDRTIVNRMKQEDLNTIARIFALPLFHEAGIAGMFLLFQVKEKLQDDVKSLIQGILQSFFWSEMSSRWRNTAAQLKSLSLDDPYYSLKQYIEDLEQKLTASSTPYSVLSLQIENLNRITNILGPDAANQARSTVLASLRAEKSQNLRANEILPGKFVVILPGTEKAAVWTLTKKLHKEIAHQFPKEELRPILLSKMATRPEDSQDEAKSLLFGTV